MSLAEFVMKRARRDHSGFTLVEVLVALVILSVGMLGMAALFLEGLRSSRSALFRTQAVQLAADMGDRIRANRYIAAGSQVYDPATTVAAANNTCDSTTTSTSTCTAQQMFANDLARWQADVQTRLPGGTGTVTFQVVNSLPTYTISVTWTQAGEIQGRYDLTVRS
jgi:type IV pilus assembly protein PilV